MEGNKLLIKPFDFSKFFNKEWTPFFRKLFAESKQRHDDAAESMGGGEVPGVPVLPGSHTNDQKYLSQFHPDIQEQALKRRYNQDLLDVGEYWDAHGELPPSSWDTTKELRFKIPGARKGKGKPYYRVYTSIDGQPIYTGSAELAKKLSNPAKPAAGSHVAHPEKFKEGPGLGDIDTSKEDDVENYLSPGHGFYDFDLSGVVRQTDSIIDATPDEEVIEWLGGEWKKMWDESPKDQEGNKILPLDLKKEIAKRKAAAKAEPSHTMAGYEPMKKNVANRILTNWIKATSLGLLGEVPEKTNDPITGKEVPVIELPYEKAKEQFSHIDYLQAGFNPLKTRLKPQDTQGLSPAQVKSLKANKYHSGDVKNLSVYVIPRTVSWRDEDESGTPVDHKTETIYVPYLPDTKTIPKLDGGVELTTLQKAILAHRENPKLLPKGSPEEMEKRYKELEESQVKSTKALVQRASNLKDITRIIDNWDLWTPEQINHFKTNGRNISQISKAYYAQDKSDDHYSNLNKSMATLGYSANRLSIKQGYLGIKPEKIEAFKHKYRGLMVGEARDAIDKWVAIHKKGGGRYPLPLGIVDTLNQVSDQIMVVSAYFLLTWLNDPRLGIFDSDPKYGLNSEKTTTEAESRKLRSYKVFWIMETLSQAAILDWPSRRAREKFNFLYDSLDRGVSSGEGKSSTVGDMGTGSKEDMEKKLKGFRYGHSARRGFRTPGQEVARKSWKINIQGTEAKVEEFMHTIRSRVRKLLGDEAGNVVDNAEAKVAAALTIATNLTKTYMDKYSKQYPNDPAKAEEMANHELMNNLSKELKVHPELFGEMSPEEADQFADKIKNKISSKSSGMSSSELEKFDNDYVQKLRKAMDEFFEKLLMDGHARQPTYDAGTQEFVDDDDSDGAIINLMNLRIKNPNAHKDMPPDPAFLVKILKSLYPQDNQTEIEHGLNKYALDIYQELLDWSHVGSKPDAEAIKDLEAVGVRPVQAKYAQKEPTPAPVPHMPAPVPAKAATTSTNELVGSVNNITNAEDLKVLLKSLLSKKDEIAADPSMRTVIKQLPAQITKTIVSKGIKVAANMEDISLIKQFNKMASEL